MSYPKIFDFFDRYCAPRVHFWNIISASSRAPAMFNFITKFRAMNVNGRTGSDALASQFVLGVLSATGGGLLYNSLFHQKYQICGWYFNVVAIVVAFFLFSQEYKYLNLGITEFKFLLICLVSIGFNLKPLESIEKTIEKTPVKLSKPIILIDPVKDLSQYSPVRRSTRKKKLE
jgi:hypothetical protein